MNILTQEILINKIICARKGVFSPNTYTWPQRSFYELEIHPSGQFQIKTESKTFQVKQPAIIFKPKNVGDIVDIYVEQPFYLISFDIATTLNLDYFVYYPKNIEPFIELYEKLQSLNTTYSFESISLLYKFLSLLETSTKEAYLSKKNRTLIQNVKQQLDEHYCEENFRIAHIQEIFNVSPTYLRRIFKQYFHMSPEKYLILKRIQKAKHLLENTRMPIYDIAYDCGFTSPLYFSRIFKKQTGFSPSQYRTFIYGS